MNNDHDMDLIRLFEENREPAPDEVFVRRVAKRIALLRYFQWVTRILLVLAGGATLALAKSWLMDLTSYIALGSSLVTNSVVTVFFSPAGWAIGGALGLPFFLKTLIVRKRL